MRAQKTASVGRAVAWAILVVLFTAHAGQAEDTPAGVYVNSERPSERVELLPGGTCFEAYWGAHGEGTYSLNGDSITCAVPATGQPPLRLRVQGNVLIGEDGARWVPSEQFATIPWKDLSPVTFVVVDAETGAPVTEFTYEYSIAASDGWYHPALVRPTPVSSPDGAFTIQAPRSCQVALTLEGGSIVGEYWPRPPLNVMSDDAERRFEVAARMGVTVKGTVTDAETGKPVEGARVSPITLTPPSSTSDARRGAGTDDAGRFTVHGVEPFLGIHVSHPDYTETEEGNFGESAQRDADGSYLVKVELQAGGTIFGVVTDPAGTPVAGVCVSDGGGKEVRTGEDGSFTLKGIARRRAHSLYFRKEGYVDTTLHSKSADPKGVSVVLLPSPVLAGTVVDADGKPVPVYCVSAGPEPDPGEWQCTLQDVDDLQGRFCLHVRKGRDHARKGKSWVGVSASGYALYEDSLDDWDGTRTITIALERGVTLSGSVALLVAPPADTTVELRPQRGPREGIVTTGGPTQRQIMGTLRTRLGADGTFRLDHVRPGAYVLSVYGPSIASIGLDVSVPEQGLDVGTLAAGGTGTVYGRVLSSDPDHRGEAWPFAAGRIYLSDASGPYYRDDLPHLKPISFRADEEGRFRIDGVPAGDVTVSIPFNVSADIIDAYTRDARVVEGEATEVRFFDPSEDWALTCEIVVGDGSPEQYLTGTGLGAERKVDNVTTREPMLMIALGPTAEGPISYPLADWETLNDERSIVLHDVAPGTYMIRIVDWAGSTGATGCVVHEQAAGFGPASRSIKVRLGAGCITGRATWPMRDDSRVAKVFAVRRGGGRPYETWCFGEGNFCVRYLPAGDYELYAHDHDAGWARLGEVSVKDAVHDVGTLRLARGGTIEGHVALPAVVASATEVVAIDRNGIRIRARDFKGPSGERYAISGLWPGDWRVELRRGEALLATADVRVRGTMTVIADLIAGQPELPTREAGPKEQ